MDTINVYTSWNCEDILQCFTLGSKENPTMMDDIVDSEKCVCLTSTEDTSVNPCTIDVSARQNIPIAFTKINIVSQCRMIELFGYNGEYVHTFQGELFDDFDGTAVYVTSIQLRSPLTSFTMKFTRIKENEFWIYGIYITKVNLKIKTNLPITNPLVAGPSTSLNMPNQMPLSNTTYKIPANTNNPMSVNTSQMPDIENFKSLFQLLNVYPDLPQLLSKYIQGHSLAQGVNPPTDSNVITKESASSNLLENDVEKVFKEELQRLETKILDHVNKRFDLLEHKQDLILNKLEEVLMKEKKPMSEAKSNGTHNHCTNVSMGVKIEPVDSLLEDIDHMNQNM